MSGDEWVIPDSLLTELRRLREEDKLLRAVAEAARAYDCGDECERCEPLRAALAALDK